MAFCCRFLGNLQVAIKNWEYSKIKLAQNFKYWPPLPFFDHVRFTCILFPTYVCFSELTPPPPQSCQNKFHDVYKISNEKLRNEKREFYFLLVKST